MATPFSTETKKESGISGKVLLIAALVVGVLVAIAAIATLHRPAVSGNAPDSYAPSLGIANIQLSEATNGAGGKVTYVDGTLKNSGAKTLQGAIVQVTFAAGDGSVAQTQTVPMTLVRTRTPYIDLEPISLEPLASGSSHDFRLIFESVPENWNQKPPDMRVVHSDVR